MEELAEKLNEYENTIDNLKCQLAFKDDQINMLNVEVLALNENITALTVELEQRNEHITQITDKLHHEMEEKEVQWQFERDRLKQKFDKEVNFLRDSELSSSDQRTALSNQLSASREKNEELQKQLDAIKGSKLTRHSQRGGV